MGRQDKCIVPMLEHARREPQRERMGGYVYLAQNHFATPPAHEAYRVCVNEGHEEVFGPASPHRLCANFFRCEPHLGADDLGCGEELCCDICAADCGTVFTVEDSVQVRVSGGSMFS